MKDNKTKKKEVLSFKVDENLKERIERRASEANRSMSNFVITLLTRALDDIDRNEQIMR